MPLYYYHYYYAFIYLFKMSIQGCCLSVSHCSAFLLFFCSCSTRLLLITSGNWKLFYVLSQTIIHALSISTFTQPIVSFLYIKPKCSLNLYHYVLNFSCLSNLQFVTCKFSWYHCSVYTVYTFSLIDFCLYYYIQTYFCLSWIISSNRFFSFFQLWVIIHFITKHYTILL